MEKSGNTMCKSVFKGGGNATTKERFTRAWIDLIDRMEKNKELALAPKQ